MTKQLLRFFALLVVVFPITTACGQKFTTPDPPVVDPGPTPVQSQIITQSITADGVPLGKVLLYPVTKFVATGTVVLPEGAKIADYTVSIAFDFGNYPMSEVPFEPALNLGIAPTITWSGNTWTYSFAYSPCSCPGFVKTCEKLRCATNGNGLQFKLKTGDVTVAADLKPDLATQFQRKQ